MSFMIVIVIDRETKELGHLGELMQILFIPLNS